MAPDVQLKISFKKTYKYSYAINIIYTYIYLWKDKGEG